MYVHIDLVQPEEFMKSKKCSLFLRHAFLSFTTKQQSTIAAVRNSYEDMFAFDTRSFFLNVSYKRAHMSNNRNVLELAEDADSISVSKLYVTFFLWCCSQSGR